MAAYTEGVPCWADALLPDVEAGKRFYGELFGWTFDEGAGPEYGHYAQAYKEGKAVAALAPKQDGRMPTVWNVYFATPDAPATARRIKDAGGQLVMEPMPVGPFGTMALAADPEGAVFGLWQGGTHEGFEKSGEPDSFCWTEVKVRDAARADAFYETVFGFEGFDLDGVIDGFRTWSPAGSAAGPDTAVGGRELMGEDLPAELPAHFLVYFTVDDCDEAARVTRRLGGRVQSPPVDIPYGRIATLVDNQGAVFAVLQDHAD
ncbi:VOC family protein [Streptomyces sp. TRM66268-LWL]|uniref:VOC family protein n=1 Tax=Streptomyces polyasparticus TaxID=2767826 RepID=A0ABR7SLR3_9ACTN|nr:VOC family protein [Streptomyces polyasparticus]MBC9716373.1 VOC family protein [Streptomyces polyasparticus]